MCSGRQATPLVGVLTYNNKVTMVPSNIVASIANFKTGVFFEALENQQIIVCLYF